MNFLIEIYIRNIINKFCLKTIITILPLSCQFTICPLFSIWHRCIYSFIEKISIEYEGFLQVLNHHEKLKNRIILSSKMNSLLTTEIYRTFYSSDCLHKSMRGLFFYYSFQKKKQIGQVNEKK